jgi:hypothetical protein
MLDSHEKIDNTLLAERQGFEPWDDTVINGFRDRPIQPLWHLSGIHSVRFHVRLLKIANKNFISCNVLNIYLIFMSLSDLKKLLRILEHSGFITSEMTST